MKLNKTFSYMAMGVAAACVMGSCCDDNGSNPTLIEPQEGGFIVFQPEFGENVVDLSQDVMTADDGITLAWNQPVYTDNGAPIGNLAGSGIVYKVMLSPTGNFTKAYDPDKLNVKTGVYEGEADFDYVVMDNKYTSTTTTLLAKDLNMTLNRWNQFSSLSTGIWQEGQDCAPLKVSVKVEARIDAGIDNTVASITSNAVSIYVKPYYTLPYDKPTPEPIFMPGNGNGWNHGVCPVLAWDDNHDALCGYAYMDGEFKFTPQPNWDAEYNGSHFEQSLCSDNITLNGGGNIQFTGTPGMYFLEVNLDKKSLIATSYVWRLVGDFNSWNEADDAQVMTYDKEEHCLKFENAGVNANGWKFVANGSWAVNLGGDINNLTQDGSNLSDEGATIRLYLERTKENMDNFKYRCTVE